MHNRTVFIFYADGSYNQREFPSAESAASFARLTCEHFTTAGVQQGDQVLRVMGLPRV